MMRRLLNACFVVVAALLLAFPLASISLGSLSVDLPGDLPFYNEKSQLEGRKYAEYTALTRESWSSGKFQAEFEKFTSDHIPFRDDILLFDAAQQRVPISIAATLFGYGIYPSFYGSKYYVMPEDRIVIERSASIPKSQKDIDLWNDLLNRTAEEHPEVRMSVCYVLEPKHDSMNPTYALFGGDGLINREWVQRALVDELAPSIHSEIVSIDSIENMKTEWFRTDHHWNLRAALSGYNRIAMALGLQVKTWDPNLEVRFIEEWQGSFARSGRDYDYPDALVDQADDFSSLRYYRLGKTEPGSEISPGYRETFLDGAGTNGGDDAPEESSGDDDSLTSAYSTYYGGQNMEIFNDGDNNGRTCLFIGDSYSRCLFRYFASNYEHTIYILPGNYKMKQKLGDYFDQYGIDDVIVVVHAEKYGVIEDESPAFFK